LDCFHHLLAKNPNLPCGFSNEAIAQMVSTPPKLNGSFEDLQTFANNFQITIQVYGIAYFKRYQSIKLEVVKNPVAAKPLATFSFLMVAQNWGAIYEKKKKQFLGRFRCSTCIKWAVYKNNVHFLKEHQKRCRRCHCGAAYLQGDNHTCKRTGKGKKPQKPQCRVYKPQEGEGNYLKDNHHADFEAHPDKNGLFIPDCVGLHIAGKPSKDEAVDIFEGPECLDQFMNYIINNLKGILWFFCGGRFDTFLILKWLIKNNIPINHEKTMMKPSTITVLSFKTKKGELDLKDLGRFLPGSLDFNCKGLGLADDESKMFFDHNKVKSWEDYYQHKEERLTYLRRDVISQKTVYETVAKQFWIEYKLNMCEFVSLSQLAFACFSMEMLQKDLHRTKKEDEAAFREAYRGGRLVLTYPSWYSNRYQEIIDARDDPEKLKQIFETLEDYLMYFDKNSLYPSVMYDANKKQKYPCGKYKLVENEAFFDREGLLGINNPRKNEHETDFWESKLLKVDVVCPRDILIPFLMSRNKEGRNTQDLNDKIATWYTGPEIVEAVKIGYKITKIHAWYEWSEYKEIFGDFIKSNYEKKKNAKRDTAPYLLSKNIMNSLSGKFGQIGIEKKTRLLIGDQIQRHHFANDENQPIWDTETDQLLAMIEEYDDPQEYSPYPIHFSAFILGKSRVSMSEFKRLTNAYRNPNHTSVYGDTDSLITPTRAIVGVDKKEFGPELGQMKDELPKAKIIALITLAPKMYMKLYIQFNKVRKCYELVSDFTAKGIPHRKECYRAFPYHSYIQPPLVAQRAKEIYDFLTNREDTKQRYPEVFLKFPYFLQFKGDELIAVRDRMTWDDVQGILHGTTNSVVLYGGMTRQLKMEVDFEKVGIGIDYNRREIAAELWWNKGVRLFYKGDEGKRGNRISYPRGHMYQKDCVHFYDILLN
jgi:hypothetical protein